MPVKPLAGHADVVVVGSGPSGSAFASVILEDAPLARVIMLESGPLISNPPGRHVRTIVDPAARSAAQIASQGPIQEEQRAFGSADGARAEVAGETLELNARPGTWLVGLAAGEGENHGLPAAAMSSNVGGMGAHWTCACPEPGIGERVPFIDEAELAAAFDRGRDLLSVDQHAFDGAPLGDEVRGILARLFDEGRPAARRVQPMPLAVKVAADGSRYWSGTDVVLRDIADSPRFELRPLTVARRVLVEDGHASGVLAFDRETEQEYVLTADYVVVAADPFRTPQLLFASGIRPAALGHYLNDQPQASGTVLLDDRLRPADGVTTTAEGTVDLLSGVSWIPYEREGFPFHGQIMQLDASPVPVDDGSETWPGSIVEVGLFAAKDIRYEDRVEFDENDLDPFGLPRLSIHYGLTQRDEQSVATMVERIEWIGKQLGSFVNGARPYVFPPGSSMHYQGTVRMGRADDGTSVCDEHGLVWGIDNVYVGGNGVIPAPTACNPTLTNVAHAVHGAQSLAARITAR